MEKGEDSSVRVYLNGLGLGSIAAAMYLIQKANFNASNIAPIILALCITLAPYMRLLTIVVLA